MFPCSIENISSARRQNDILKCCVNSNSYGTCACSSLDKTLHPTNGNALPFTHRHPPHRAFKGFFETHSLQIANRKSELFSPLFQEQVLPIVFHLYCSFVFRTCCIQTGQRLLNGPLCPVRSTTTGHLNEIIQKKQPEREKKDK